MAQVIITVTKEGKTSIKAEGYLGPSCSLATAPFIAALGKEKSTTVLPEMFQEAQQSLEVTQ